MKNRLTACVLGSYLALSCIVSGSEEEDVVLKTIKITATEHKQTGKVSFAAEKDGVAFKSISITAFGKQYHVAEKDLAKFKGFPLVSIRITHEAGYASLGGHTIYFKMRRINYKPKKPVIEQIRISISKKNGIEIHELEARKIKGQANESFPDKPET